MSVEAQAVYRALLLDASSVFPWDCMQFAAIEAGFILVAYHARLGRVNVLDGKLDDVPVVATSTRVL